MFPNHFPAKTGLFLWHLSSLESVLCLRFQTGPEKFKSLASAESENMLLVIKGNPVVWTRWSQKEQPSTQLVSPPLLPCGSLPGLIRGYVDPFSAEIIAQTPGRGKGRLSGVQKWQKISLRKSQSPVSWFLEPIVVVSWDWVSWGCFRMPHQKYVWLLWPIFAIFVRTSAFRTKNNNENAVASARWRPVCQNLLADEYCAAKILSQCAQMHPMV